MSKPLDRYEALGKAFSPSAPIDDRDLFAGRREQLNEVGAAVTQKGQHVIMFGERGVGKTSLANTIARGIQGVAAAKTNCDGSDSFGSVWKKVFYELNILTGGTNREIATLPDGLDGDVSPDDIRKRLTRAATTLGHDLVLIVDEFDRLRLPKKEKAHFSDLIKALSDFGTPATIILVGVADSVNDLLTEHASVERALVQVSMPRMSDLELEQIVNRGLERASMTIETAARTSIVRLSQGLPHYTHLLGLQSGYAALNRGATEVGVSEVESAIQRGVEKAQESIRSAYDRATFSPRRNNLYPQVLLACALATPDARGFFLASSVREPICRIMKRELDIPAFSRHLNDFCEKERGPVLGKTGTTRKFRFRFLNPLMQPFVIMHGLSKKTITAGDLSAQ